MEFKTFAKKLKNVIGGASNTSEFTKTIFETMMNDSGSELLTSIKQNTFKAYFNGHTSIKNVAAIVLANLSDEDGFASYLEDFGETTAQLLADEFEEDIPEINACNASEKITELFLEILREASGKKKSTPKSAAKIEDKPSHDILEQKILDSGQALADAWSNAISNLGASKAANESERIALPEEQTTDEFPYLQEDKTLLQEFVSDYDDIMVMMIGENYAASLLDMTIPNNVEKLYASKWRTKADTFHDPALKAYVFGLLGELNKLSESFLTGNQTTLSIRNTRAKIRNLYVKLHPGSFVEAFPYDAFIDDWNDGEY